MGAQRIIPGTSGGEGGIMTFVRSRLVWILTALCGLVLSALVVPAIAHAQIAGNPQAPAAPAGPTGSVYVPVAPVRLLDTRVGLGAPVGVVGSHQSVTLRVVGGVVPASVTAVAGNVTVTEPRAAGWVSVGPAPTSSSSNLNFVVGQTVPNLVVSQVSGAGTISLYNGSPGTVPLVADRQGYEVPAPLMVSTAALQDGVAGLPYTQQLVAMGGAEPYSWTGSGLPSGLSVSSDGVVSGTPTGSGSSQVSVTVTDGGSRTATATYGLAVPESLPAGCIGQACAQLTPDGQTVQIPATRVGAVIRDGSSNVVQLRLAGAPPSVGQVLVVAPTADTPPGLIVVADAVTDNGDGTSTVDVSPAAPADAYAQGTVKAIGTVAVASAATTRTAKAAPLSAADKAKAARASATAKAAGVTGT